MTRPRRDLDHAIPELRDFERAIGRGGSSQGGHLPTRAQRERIAWRVVAQSYECPQQRELLLSVRRHQKVATHKTRRGGATDALGRYALANMIAHDNWICAVVVVDLKSYTRNWLERPGGDSAMSLLREAGLAQWCTIERSAGAITRIALPWGSELWVLNVASAHALGRKRGMAAKLWLVEEAQEFTNLHAIMAQLINPTLADFGGAHVVLNGTPQPDLDTFFARAVLSRGEDADWLAVVVASWRNPYYGATFEERWRHLVEKTLNAAANQYGLSAEEYDRIAALSEADLDAIMLADELPTHLAWVEDLAPDLLRESFGRWVGDAGRLVFAWNRAHYWAAGPWARIDDVAGTVRAAFEALRQAVGPLDWQGVASHDLGYRPDPAAWTLFAWAHDHPRAYELWSAKRHEMGLAEQFELLVALSDAARAAGLPCSSVVVDLDASGPGTRDTWMREFQMRTDFEITPALKAHKDRQIFVCNLAVARGELSFIRGSEIDAEGRHLRYHPTKAGVIDKHRVVYNAAGKQLVPGDHCLDGMRYSIPHLGAVGQETPEERAARRQADARAREVDLDVIDLVEHARQSRRSGRGSRRAI
jgi:hypothetical protein